jgi:hypothetical protein
VLRALRAHLASPDVESWVAEVAAAREAVSQALSLAAEVAAAEARVEKVADALTRIGFSDTLARRLRTEESKLADLRGQLARSAPAPKGPRVTTAKLLAALAGLDVLAAKRPEQARTALLAVVEEVVLTPTPDGKVSATLRLKNETAAIVAAVSVLNQLVAGACTRGMRAPPGQRCSRARLASLRVSDGDRVPQLPSQIPAPEPLSFFLPRLRGARF